MPVQAHAQLGPDARPDHRLFRALLAAVLPAGHRRSVLRRGLQRSRSRGQRLQLARLLQLAAESGHLRHLGPQLSTLFPPPGAVRLRAERHRRLGGRSGTARRRHRPSSLRTVLSTEATSNSVFNDLDPPLRKMFLASHRETC